MKMTIDFENKPLRYTVIEVFDSLMGCDLGNIWAKAGR
jgi:hypothetical protein